MAPLGKAGDAMRRTPPRDKRRLDEAGQAGRGATRMGTTAPGTQRQGEARQATLRGSTKTRLGPDWQGRNRMTRHEQASRGGAKQGRIRTTRLGASSIRLDMDRQAAHDTARRGEATIGLQRRGKEQQA